ncbi:DUF4179 domain-containing protein [Clostridium lacusfryxellense]|uniref:DUF4179 domain-containing protein n=1 Tax=Clostridium lacusfryxellense TaxID=205328 RepID=UPI001C0D3F46|nr:DUF4179 domain-containing protein [Clostridium lacusfryxellense]MBU3114457.1 DUF4179 domain-containing protein [Clostridium lacusfryxellense]
MNDEDIFDIIDNISEDNLSIIMENKISKIDIENSFDTEKDLIRAKLHEKIKMDAEKHDIPQENNLNNKNHKLIRLVVTDLKMKRKSKKEEYIKRNKAIINIIKSVVAAMLVFVVLVNVSPKLALALVRVPGLEALIKVVNFDSGFKNVIDNGNIQEVNTTIEDKGVKFTVTTITGDDLKLWIGYEIENKDLRFGKIRFINKADGKELPWSIISQESKGYIEVAIEGLVKDFKMEIEVYKDDPSFNKPFSELDEKAKNDIKQLFIKNKITTLSIPILLNDKIYNKDLEVVNVHEKEFKSEVGLFKIEKLELSKSRSRVYCKLVSAQNKLTGVIEPRLVDGDGIEYSSSNQVTVQIENNMIYVETQGGITNAKGLSFKCDGFEYINKQGNQITIDIKNKQIETNKLGISLNNINATNIILNVPENEVEFELKAKNEKGKKIEIKEVELDSFNHTAKLMFNDLNDEKVILNVRKIQYIVPKGLNMILID